MFEDLKEQFRSVIEYSQNIPTPQVDELFERWAEAKRDFIEAFGGKLIVEMPNEMAFSIGDSEKEIKVRDFQCLIENKYRNYALSDFVDAMIDGFYKNETVQAWTAPDGTKIPKGMKIIKAFKYFEEDKEALFNLQNEASRIIQEDKIRGKLCFSVHPLDFLSASENNHNWRSCHALDGEYRAGNLSYMVDNSTVMAYLKSENDEKLPDFPDDVPWNSKKWRVLLFFSNDWKMLFAGRPYPFASETGIEQIRRLLPILGFGPKWSEWKSWKSNRLKDEKSDTIVDLRYKLVPVGEIAVPMKRLVKDLPGSLQYDDLLNSSCYDPIYCYQEHDCSWVKSFYTGMTTDDTQFFIGGSVNCLCCGKKPISISETMMCNDCESEYGELNSEDFGYCACCNRHIYLGDAIWVGDEPICPSCVDTELERCDCCGELFYQSDIVYNREREQTLCRWCDESLDNRPPRIINPFE